MNKSENRFQVFAHSYVKSLNATQAAKEAGYSKKTAYSQGQRLLKNVEVAELIGELQKAICAKHNITADRVLQEIALLAFSNMDDYMDVLPDGAARGNLLKTTRDQRAAIQEIKVDESAGGAGDGVIERVKRTTFKLADKGLNLERLGRHLKLFTDRIEIKAGSGLAERLAKIRKAVSDG